MRNSLGQVIRAERKRKEMRQSELADRAGISQWSLSHYERDSSVPSFNVMCYIADALGIDLNTIRREWEEGIDEEDE